MNLAPLDSSRQAAFLSQKSSKIKKIYFFANFEKIFIWKEAVWREESNGVKFIAVGCLITELWPFKVLKFQTAITPLLSDLERWIWHRWIPLVKQLFWAKNLRKLKKNIFLRISQKFYLKRSCLTRGIQRCKIHCRRLLNNGAMAV
jgi:hypothetical protein